MISIVASLLFKTFLGEAGANVICGGGKLNETKMHFEHHTGHWTLHCIGKLILSHELKNISRKQQQEEENGHLSFLSLEI